MYFVSVVEQRSSEDVNVTNHVTLFFYLFLCMEIHRLVCATLFLIDVGHSMSTASCCFKAYLFMKYVSYFYISKLLSTSCRYITFTLDKNNNHLSLSCRTFYVKEKCYLLRILSWQFRYHINDIKHVVHFVSV